MNLRTLMGMMIVAVAAEGRGQIVLNEVMSDNRSAVANGGEFPDYIELHNRGSQSVSLAGMSLTDNPTSPRQYVFPSGLSIAAGGHLVVWCDSSYGSPGQHTGFALGAKGDRVLLYAPDGVTVLDEVTFGLQVPNLSLGRVPTGTGAWTLVGPSPRQANVAQALGTGGQLRINEWMARPLTGEDWLEVYNGEGLPVSVGGMILTDNPTTSFSNRAIPANSFLAARGFTQFFASDLARSDADHLDFKLGASGETLTLYFPNRVTMADRVVFGAQVDDLSQGRSPDGSDNIVTFPAGRSTPGQANFQPLVAVVISEVLAHTDPPLEDAIELHNPTAAPVDISHWWLSDTATQPRKYRIPSGTVLQPGAYRVFYQAQFGAGTSGFSLNSSQGDEVYLSAGDSSGNLTGAQTYVEFGATRNGVSVGRHRTSLGVEFVPMSARSFGVDNPSTLTQFRQGTGRSNPAPRIGPLVISEIHHHPAPDGSEEYLELHNPGGTPVPLYHPTFPTNTWRLRGGVTYDFPMNRVVPAGGYVVVVGFDPAADAEALAEFRFRYNVPLAVPVLGPYAGSLSDLGESIELLWPDETQGPDKPDAGFTPYELVERIDYGSGSPWPAGTAGTGQSLHRGRPGWYGNDPVHWVAGVPTPGRPGGEAWGADADRDGMPDAWEAANGLDPSDATDAGADADADGAGAFEEYRAGTDPQDGGSVLALRGVRPVSGGVLVTFGAVSGKAYQIQFRAGFDAAGWQTLATIPEASFTGDLETLVVPPAGPSGIFRIILGGY